MTASPTGLVVIVISLAVALWLSILPMPEWALWLRPAWMAMVLLYWVIALPHRIGIGVAWCSGIMLDAVVGAPLGQNALALSILAYLTLVLYQRMRMYSPLQQAGVIFILVGINQMLGHWVQTITGTASPNLMFLMPALFSALMWPVVFRVLRFFRRQYQVY